MLVAAHQTAYVHSSLPNCTCSTTHSTSQAHISYETYVTTNLYWLLLNSSDICHSVCHYSACGTHCEGTRGCLVCWKLYHWMESCDWQLSCFWDPLCQRYVCSSLLNIYQELHRDIPGFEAPRHGNLIGWARQGECAVCCGRMTDWQITVTVSVWCFAELFSGEFLLVQLTALNDAVSPPRRPGSSFTLLWKPQDLASIN